MSEPTPGGEVTFEVALAELEQIVRQLEEGNIGLGESLAHYERGVKRLRECYRLLEGAERRIELLERVGADGEPVTRPFDDEASIERQQRQEAAEKDRSSNSPGAGTAATRAPKAAKGRTIRSEVIDGDVSPGLF